MASISYIHDLKEWSQTFHFNIEVKVRFSDTDAYGHLNNTKVFVYFEEARIEFLKSLHLFSEEMETMVVVRDLQCDFLKEVYFDERLTVYCKVEEVGNTSIDLHYMVLNEQKDLVLTARGRLVQLSKETKLPIPWSEDVRKRLIES